MVRIEIYGRSDRKTTKDAERFCIKAGYPHIMRDLKDDSICQAELVERLGCVSRTPQIFIGSEHIGTLKDLMALESYIVQQKIGD